MPINYHEDFRDPNKIINLNTLLTKSELESYSEVVKSLYGAASYFSAVFDGIVSPPSYRKDIVSTNFLPNSRYATSLSALDIAVLTTKSGKHILCKSWGQISAPIAVIYGDKITFVDPNPLSAQYLKNCFNNLLASTTFSSSAVDQLQPVRIETGNYPMQPLVSGDEFVLHKMKLEPLQIRPMFKVVRDRKAYFSWKKYYYKRFKDFDAYLALLPKNNSPSWYNMSLLFRYTDLKTFNDKALVRTGREVSKYSCADLAKYVNDNLNGYNFTIKLDDIVESFTNLKLFDEGLISVVPK